MFTSKQVEKSTPDMTIANVVELTIIGDMSKTELLSKMIGKLFIDRFRNAVLTPAFHFTETMELLPVVLISANCTDSELHNAKDDIYRVAQICNMVLDVNFTPMRVNNSTVLVGVSK